MNGKREHLRLVGRGGGEPGWKKLVRFIFRLALVLLLLLLVRTGDAYFRVKTIRVVGAVTASPAAVAAAGGIAEGMSMILFREEMAAERITGQLPQVKSARVSRELPHTVIINVDERVPAAYVAVGNGFWLIDSEAVAIFFSRQAEGPYPLIDGIDEKLIVPGLPLGCPSRQKILQAFFSAWPGGLDLELEKINLSSTYNLVLHVAGGPEIWLGDGSNMDQKLYLVGQGLPHVADTAPARLDVRSANRLVVTGRAHILEEGVDP